MTVFKPKGPSELFGTRFWSSQYVRYAGYTQDENGGILGDPANLGITEYLLKNGYWSSPSPQTSFDVLPLVLKVPGREEPYVYQLPKEFVFEVNIEHPTMPEMKTLGYHWATVPAISNFKMNLGGVLYQNMPFNGWFMSTEIVRNLMERYDAGPAIAKVMGLDMANHPAWRQVVASEVSVFCLLVHFSVVLIASN
jgi:nitric oxide synthase oxygenase domain/subunit